MRWERLFQELEAQAGDLDMLERDALVDELRDGEWAETSWRSLLGGAVVIDVIGVGRIEGECVLANEQVVQLRNGRAEHVVSANAVAAIVSSEHRAGPASTVSSALGWGHVFRALRSEGDPVRLQTITGSTFDGCIDVVGADFVRIRGESGRDHAVTFAAIAAVSGRT
jgi:hypothetical protein